uniref:Uncharacterized protein n=1 Tax=Tanacetum cinerariifolium TaxID=118510 RepID=A0A699JQG3_TANCI|nr:hypothetical protein [Tanacetum cinerariifolium]
MDNGMRLMLASRSASVKHSTIPGKSHGIRNLPGSPSFSSNFFRRTTEQCSFSGVLASSQSLALLVNKLLIDGPNFGIKIRASAKLILKFNLQRFGKKFHSQELEIQSGQPEVGRLQKKRRQRWNLRSIIRHTTSSSDCLQITSRVSNGVARKSTRVRSRDTVGVHKLEEPDFDKQELGKLEVGKPRVDKRSMVEIVSQILIFIETVLIVPLIELNILIVWTGENQEVEFDLTSSEDDNWNNAFTISLSSTTSGEIP